jgi:hypothetical protein
VIRDPRPDGLAELREVLRLLYAAFVELSGVLERLEALERKREELERKLGARP